MHDDILAMLKCPATIVKRLVSICSVNEAFQSRQQIQDGYSLYLAMRREQGSILLFCYCSFSEMFLLPRCEQCEIGFCEETKNGDALLLHCQNEMDQIIQQVPWNFAGLLMTMLDCKDWHINVTHPVYIIGSLTSQVRAMATLRWQWNFGIL